MQNPLSKLNSIQLGKPNSVTVLHHDGFSVTGAVVHAGIAGVDVQAQHTSKAIDPVTAVAEIADQLKSQGVRKLPAHTVLVSASAIGSLIDLPVSPDTPKVASQLGEMVRWELDPIFAQQNERWSIGALLMGRGYLAQDQRAHIMAEALSRNAASNQRLTVRFGEVARSLELVTREQLDECLELQEKLVSFDDDIVCGWAAQKPGIDDVDEEAPRYPWYVTAVADGMRKQWVKACQRQRLFLSGIYPVLGSGFASLSSSGRDLLYIDIQQEEFCVMRGKPGALVSLRTENAVDGYVSSGQVSALCLEELRPDLNDVVVNVDAARFVELQQAMQDTLGREMRLLSSQNPQGVAA